MSQDSLYTIGYGNRTFIDFLSLLKKFEITYLIDVRTSPYSKFNPNFSKDVLAKKLKSNLIRYVFMGDKLGGKPDDYSCFTNGKVDYGIVERKEFYKEGISRLIKAYDSRCKVVIMCSEMKPEECHRSKLIGETLDRNNIPLIHIDEKGKAQDHFSVISKITKGQSSIFGNNFTSRKSY